MSCHITRSELARIAKVSPAAVTKACRKELAPACQRDRVDLDHALVRGYLARHGVTNPRREPTPERPSKPAPKEPPRPAKKPEAKSAAPPPAPAADLDLDKVPADIREFLDYTLRQIYQNFGSERRFQDLLDSLKKIQDIRAKELDNAETEGSLISRELVQTHVIGAFDSAFRRLLENAPKTAARELYAMCRNDLSIEEAEHKLRTLLSKELQVAKTAASKALK